MAKRDQLPLDLQNRPAMGRADFLVAPCNSAAVAWIDRWPDWPAPALVLTGPPGSGKTHIAQVWCRRSGAVPVDERSVPTLGDADHAGAFLIDDADRWTGSDDALFHLYNAVAAANGHLLLTSRTAPARWRGRLPDLVSRLAAAPTVTIEPPDDTLIAAILIKLFADRNLSVGQDVLSYLVNRIDRAFEAATSVVADIDRAALAEKRPVTVRLAGEVLARRAAAGRT